MKSERVGAERLRLGCPKPNTGESAPAEPRGEPVYQVESVWYRHLGQFPALAGVSLQVRRGELIALLGANGSGKSTLLRLLAGLLFAEQGRVVAFGSELTPQTLEDRSFGPAFRARVGVLFQHVESQLFNATVEEEIAFAPLQMGLAPEEVAGRVRDLLELFGLGALRERPPFRLSGGEKKRVALAAVLAQNPEVLLLDEPLAGLDPRSQDQVLDLLAELHAGGRTLVLATHDVEIARLLATRVVILGEDHRVRADGPPELLDDVTLLVDVNLISARPGRRVFNRRKG